MCTCPNSAHRHFRTPNPRSARESPTLTSQMQKLHGIREMHFESSYRRLPYPPRGTLTYPVSVRGPAVGSCRCLPLHGDTPMLQASLPPTRVVGRSDPYAHHTPSPSTPCTRPTGGGHSNPCTAHRRWARPYEYTHREVDTCTAHTLTNWLNLSKCTAHAHKLCERPGFGVVPEIKEGCSAARSMDVRRGEDGKSIN